MRILLVNSHFSPISFGGATIVAEEISQRLAALGHEVVVVTSVPEHLLPYGQLQRYEALGLPVVAIGRTTPRSADEEYHQPRLASRLRQILDVVRPDVVHFHAVQGLGVEMVRGAVETGYPTVVTLHDAWWLCERQFMVRATGEWCGQSVIDPATCATCVADSGQHRMRQQESLQILNSCARVLVPSDYWRGLMLGSGVASDVLQVNANGVTHPVAHRAAGPPSAPIRFGYVGGADVVKGAHQLRRAMADLTDVDLSLTLIDANQFLGLPGLRPEDWQFPNTQVLPAYSNSGLDDFFDSIDVLVFPSQTRESYGLTVREALLRGVWVLATEGGGTSEVLTDGVNATLIPMDGTHVSLEAAMRDMAAHPSRYRGRARPTGRIPTFDDQAAELHGIYLDVRQTMPPLPSQRMQATTSTGPHSVPGSW